MSRPIKFRAHTGFEWIYWVPEDEQPWSDEHGFWAMVQMKNYFNVCEFTGLKDKNGKEIYEGDILCSRGESHHRHTVVEWQDDIQDGDLVQTVAVGYWFPSEDEEVVGNIYEHPELKERENHAKD